MTRRARNITDHRADHQPGERLKPSGRVLRDYDKLTDKQRLILQYLQEHADRDCALPSVLVIARRFNLSSHSVWSHINALRAKGYLKAVGEIESTIRLTGKRPPTTEGRAPAES